jgi:hypothetical protein
MIQRCMNPNASGYENYGGRGIKVCDRWLNSFEAFREDMADRPSEDHSLDRYPNNDGNYEPGNVRWATWDQQCRNKRTNRWITYEGKTLILEDWATQLGITPPTLARRLAKLSLEDALRPGKFQGRRDMAQSD